MVSVAQLPDAMAVQTGRGAVVQLAGAPLGGALFTIGRAVPFVVDTLSYAFSMISVLGVRAKFQEVREADSSRLRSSCWRRSASSGISRSSARARCSSGR